MTYNSLWRAQDRFSMILAPILNKRRGPRGQEGTQAGRRLEQRAPLKSFLLSGPLCPFYIMTPSQFRRRACKRATLHLISSSLCALSPSCSIADHARREGRLGTVGAAEGCDQENSVRGRHQLCSSLSCQRISLGPLLPSEYTTLLFR